MAFSCVDFLLLLLLLLLLRRLLSPLLSFDGGYQEDSPVALLNQYCLPEVGSVCVAQPTLEFSFEAGLALLSPPLGLLMSAGGRQDDVPVALLNQNVCPERGSV